METVPKAVVGILSPGKMGAGIGNAVHCAGNEVLWCSAGRSAATANRAREAGLVDTTDLGELTSAVDVIFSICPPGNAGDVADEVAATGFTGLFVEANAISSARFSAIADRLESAGAQVLDACIMGKPPKIGSSTRLYLNGDAKGIGSAAGLFAESTVEVFTIPEPRGRASALKISHSTFVKLDRVIAALAHSLARSHDVGEILVDEAQHDGRFALAEPDHLPSVASRAWRWLSEMDDAADLMTEAGIPETMVLAAKEIMEIWSVDKDKDNLDTDLVLDQLRRS
jgi:3-hydroxyisobutyrate dehydrogenase-like beta-hydroxyacid dehydrogenase